jgi:hypothetical protein
MTEEDRRRGGRACATCHWFAPITDEQRARYVLGDGFCDWRDPPSLHACARSSDANCNIRDATKYWCSCWVPDMGRIG